MKKSNIFRFLPLLLVATLCACSSSPTTRHYVIEPVSSGTVHQFDADTVVVIGPVTLPERLNRREIVSHREQYRVSSAEYDRWAEPLDENIARAVAENLSILNPTGSFLAYPSVMRTPADVSVEIYVLEFGDTPNGDIVLRATWSLATSESSPEFYEISVAEIRSGDEIVSMVAAMSRLVEQLSGQIAVALAGIDATAN